MNEEQYSTSDRRPIPDPTVLTTAAPNREIAALKEWVQISLDRLKDLHQEKFDGIRTRFESQDRAVRTALETAQKAVNNNETTTNKLLDNIKESIDDLKTRQTASEGSSKGKVEGWGILVGVVGAAVAIATLVVFALKS